MNTEDFVLRNISKDISGHVFNELKVFISSKPCFDIGRYNLAHVFIFERRLRLIKQSKLGMVSICHVKLDTAESGHFIQPVRNKFHILHSAFNNTVLKFHQLSNPENPICEIAHREHMQRLDVFFLDNFNRFIKQFPHALFKHIGIVLVDNLAI